MVWTFQKLGYDDNLLASSNAKAAVEKLPPTLLLKWNKYVVHERIPRENPTTLRDWLQEQVDAHDLPPTRAKRGKGDGEKKGGRHPDGSTFAAYDVASVFSCPLNDGQHSVEVCLTFAMLSVDERPEAAKNTQFYFSCLNAGHISRKCPTRLNAGLTNVKRKTTLLSMAPDEYTATHSLGNTLSRLTSHASQRSCFKYFL